MQDVLSDEQFVGYAYHLHAPIAIENDDVVDVGAVAHELILLQSGTDEALLSVDVELLCGLDNLCGLDGVEVSNLGQARMILAILLLDICKPLDGDVGHVRQVVVDFLDFLLDACYQFVGLVLVEL